MPHRSQTFKGKTLCDLTATYAFSKWFSLTVGANNVTNVYPDKVLSNYASYSGGQILYKKCQPVWV
ncbi:MAG: hypothetical protein WKF59_14385 [Chitinophagaceae bacterium]